ncbi:hypothetical protein OKW34_004938 [Paraburkholderia youngii]|uniref:hypothetical protein n=1 Tax=Paraburkholderia youngii TaxID=2782701 RepID=UPI003D1BB5F4
MKSLGLIFIQTQRSYNGLELPVLRLIVARLIEKKCPCRLSRTSWKEPRESEVIVPDSQ